ncbi:alpha/beta fold hydrolase [Bradyrhizobium sp. CCGUVB14]|uniref:alpha/beta fold hydrolase n=1 Tax=Bradyrhizobium sp. CCGUVB14 TaxID=2949628 RepID=UPI0020B28C5A|nr:alpha/beta hydrolase [Bradyrhizobium sp. CCGUVB14]MCP3442314.1 alpha/beta hydrolase [Bradyrhizobium sp. CCGUVB14]
MTAVNRRVRIFASPRRRQPEHRSYATAAVVAAATLTAAAVINRYLANKAEAANPPVGKFVEVDGVHLHYVEHGTGEPLVLLHGNGSMVEDFVSSGLIDLAAQNYRVLAFDRPGFGHSSRPRGVTWSPDAQAALIARALEKLGVRSTLTLGHSWGASVAVALALRSPELVTGLVLASGYYYPTVRPVFAVASIPALPLIGDIIAWTIAPLFGRLMGPLAEEKIFGPQKPPPKFDRFPKEMAMRPSQQRASAVDGSLLIPNAVEFQHRYAELKMPVVIIAGDADRLIDTEKQSARLHRDISHSRFHRLSGAGHMIEQTQTDDVMAAIDEAANLH